MTDARQGEFALPAPPATGETPLVPARMINEWVYCPRLAYALLARALAWPAIAAGLDPYLGMFHRPRHGRPSLALDLMEPFRPILADSVVLMAVNNGEVVPKDFIRNGPSCALTPSGRRAFISAWERRLDQETTHPVFGYRLSMRRLLAVQCRLFARHLMGEIPTMPHYVPR